MRITGHIADLAEFAKLRELLRAGKTPCSIFGVAQSLKPLLAAALSEQENKTVIVVCSSQERAAQYAAADEQGVFIPKRALFLRSSVARSRETAFQRISAMYALLSGRAKTAYLCEEALCARLAPKEDFASAGITVKRDATYDPEELIERLVLSGYERVSSVESPGQAARRGEVLDVFSPGKNAPVRIDFFDEIVESIHEFDPISQRRSKNKLKSAQLLPAVELVLTDKTAKRCADYFRAAQPADSNLKAKFDEYARNIEKNRFFEDIENFAFAFCEDSIIEYFDDPIIIFDEYKHISNTGEEREQDFETKLFELVGARQAVADQKELYLSKDELLTRAKKHAVLDYCGISKSKDIGQTSEITVHSKNALSYNKHLDILRDDIKTRVQNGWRVYLVCGSENKAVKLSAELTDETISIPYVAHELDYGQAGTFADRLQSGFELTEKKTYFLGENDIYGFSRKKKRKAARRQEDLFSDLKTGDIIVHDIHGKGRFLGLVTRSVQGISRDYMELEYRGGDKLFIPTDQIDRVQKYMGGDNERLSKLGGKEWSATKARVKSAVKELAEDLVSIYSERLGKKGYVYGDDTIWQRQFEENFPYEETDGQLRSADEIKKDMQSEKVMDRLLLGDVGYGKTEVAMRAAFKAVMEGRQVAVLVPTTLLARQHHHSFLERFTDFAVEIESMSRFVSPKEQKRIIAGIKAGTVDVVIGTHRLLSQDIVFKDLGLLIIDEEQRFGVSHKERIKDIKRSVDVLTLSATPIPRTLQMSLTGIRDMSTIETPPEDRTPPESYVVEYSGELLHDAVAKEMEREGQTYFVCRQIGLMDKLAGDLRQNIPQARVAMAHGRMNETQIENVMEDFLAGEYDVLLCTTIIESGIDIPNVNTVIIYEADKFGLAQLYQIKGRVGRATKSSYAYLTYIRGTRMTPEAEKRLQTIAEFTEFGAGFKIAMRDLEIRGAGNMLGPEQSGQMAAVGYDMYCRLMRQAVAEVKGKTVHEEINTASVEIRMSAHVPPSYIEDEIQRIEVYKKIAAVDSLRAAKQVREEILDRYGNLPKTVENLILIALIKHFAMRAGIASVTRTGKVFTLKYAPDARTDLSKLLEVLEKQGKKAQLKAAQPPFIVFKVEKQPIDELLAFLRDISRCQTRSIKV